MLKTARRCLSRSLLVVLLATGTLQSACATSGSWRWEDVPKIVALSDVHGAFGSFSNALAAAGVTGRDGAWAAGDTHLVITGDLLDRGAESRAAMDAVMRLEREAAAAGGRVHLLLGNHEVMNLVGDLRYVADGEYAAFSDDETAAERDRWFARYAARHGGAVDDPALRARFDEAHPPGFFAHRRAFSASGEYGSWLLDKPLVVVVNDTVFTHGGLAPDTAALGLAGINRELGDHLRNYVAAIETLTKAGRLLPGDSFYDHREILGAIPDDPARPVAITAAMQIVTREAERTVHDLDGPLWYRGNASCQPIVEAPRLDAALAALGARRLVIGHTPTVTRRIVSRLDGRIIEIDTGMLTGYYGGSGHALVINGDALSVVNERGESVPIEEDPRLNGVALRDADLEALLQGAELQVAGEQADGRLRVRLQNGDEVLQAIFRPLGRRDQPGEVLAYRLDRALGLHMVPVTVLREMDGRHGSLQFEPDGLVNEAQRREARAGGTAWCPLLEQWKSMYLFDVLVYKNERQTGQMRYDRGSFQLFLDGHADAFGNRRGRPAYLAQAPLELNESWRAALAALDDASLDELFDGMLDARGRRALLRRRDELLKLD